MHQKNSELDGFLGVEQDWGYVQERHITNSPVLAENVLSVLLSRELDNFQKSNKYKVGLDNLNLKTENVSSNWDLQNMKTRHAHE